MNNSVFSIHVCMSGLHGSFLLPRPCAITGRSICFCSVLLSRPFQIFQFNFSIGLDFTTDGKYMALAERRNCKDCISIFACTSWQLVKVYIWSISRMYAVGLYSKILPRSCKDVFNLNHDCQFMAT